MKKWISFALGFTPFIYGGILVSLMSTAFYNLPFVLFFPGIIFLLLWFFLSYFLTKHTEHNISTMILLNLPGLFVLILIGIRNILPDQLGLLGLVSQTFFTPLISISSSFINRLVPYVYLAYCFSFLLMAVTSYLGYYLYQKQNK